MELRMRCHPWESTAVGPVAQWPCSLKLAVRALLDSPLPMFLAWGEGCTHFFNDACLPLLGGKPAQALGADARLTWQDPVPAIDGIVVRVRQGEPVSAKGLTLVIDRAGYLETCHFNDVYTPAYGDAGQPQGVLATFVDTAQEREQILSSERAARAEAERHNKMKDEFLAMLAHELRNPLAPITSAAQLLRLPEVSEGLRLKASNIISRQVRHMTELVDDLLDVSRVTRGLVKLENEILDLNKVAIAAVEQARPHIEERGHTLTVDLPVLPVPVEGDRTRLIQVLVNLLNNSAKYTAPGGRIALVVTTGASAATAAVRDNGSGIDVQLLPHVFDLFTQADRTPDRSQGGLGIGLALVKSIVRMHNGQVAAHSDGPQRGTSMTVTLPLADAEVGQVIRSGEGSGETRPLAITIVDDNADAGHSLAVLLRAHGHTVQVHENAVSTLAAADGVTQVFILDIGLPDMTGYELARRLRRMPRHTGAVFVALTGYGQQRDRELSQQAGFDYHLIKPVEIGKLTQILAGVGER
jgi:signal transduction histidine kinase